MISHRTEYCHWSKHWLRTLVECRKNNTTLVRASIHNLKKELVLVALAEIQLHSFKEGTQTNVGEGPM